MERREFSEATKKEARKNFAIKSLMDIPDLIMGNIQTHHKNPCKEGGSNSSRNAVALTDFHHKLVNKGIKKGRGEQYQ